MSLTVLEARSDEEIAEIRSRSREVVTALLGTPGFISWLGVVSKNRMYTITAWERAEDVAGLRDNTAHVEATERFFASPGVARGGQTGVWTAHHLNGLWARCETCDEMRQPENGRCTACGTDVTAPSYW